MVKDVELRKSIIENLRLLHAKETKIDFDKFWDELKQKLIKASAKTYLSYLEKNWMTESSRYFFFSKRYRKAAGSE